MKKGNLIRISHMKHITVCVKADDWIARFNDFVATVTIPAYDGSYPIYVDLRGKDDKPPTDEEKKTFKKLYAVQAADDVIDRFDLIYGVNKGDRAPVCDIYLVVYYMERRCS